MSKVVFLDTSQGDVAVDALIEEQTQFRSTVTEHPVEFGTDIADHIFGSPKVITLKGVVSNTVFKPSVSTPFGLENRAQAAWKLFQDLQNGGETFKVQLKMELLENMAIVDSSHKLVAETGESLSFNLVLKQILVTETEEIQLPASILQSDVKSKASTKSQGKKSKEPAPSFLLQGTRLLLGEDAI